MSTKQQPKGVYLHVDGLLLDLNIKKPRLSVAKIFNNNRILSENKLSHLHNFFIQFKMPWNIHSRSHKSVSERERTRDPESHAAATAEKAECGVHRHLEYAAQQRSTKQLLAGLNVLLVSKRITGLKFYFFSLHSLIDRAFGYWWEIVLKTWLSRQNFTFIHAWLFRQFDFKTLNLTFFTKPTWLSFFESKYQISTSMANTKLSI